MSAAGAAVFAINTVARKGRHLAISTILGSSISTLVLWDLLGEKGILIYLEDILLKERFAAVPQAAYFLTGKRRSSVRCPLASV